MNFASDNSGPAAPEIIDALRQANEGYAPSYGADPIMESVQGELRQRFEAPQARVFLVATGTAANALGLACLCPPWSAIYCHRHSHVEEDECGAPEFYTGGSKLVLLDGDHAKISTEFLAAALAGAAPVGVHNVQRGALSITNATECGAVYSPAEIAALAALAQEYGIPCHMDGARFANALASASCTPAEMTWKAGVKILSFGGTKNGLLGVEAVIIFDPDLAWEFELRRKRGGHLFSKHRFLSAQMLAYLTNDLWLRLAAQANRQAARLSAGLRQIPGTRIMHPVDANLVFAGMPRASHRRALDAGANYYLWPPSQTLAGADDEMLVARLACSWSTTDSEIDRLLECLSGCQ